MRLDHERSRQYPDRPKWKSHEEREAAIRGLATYHIWGIVCYVDIFNEEHAYKFSLYAKHQNVTHLSWGRFGNDAEEKECEAAQASN
jgi:uridine phosphorylase